MVKTPREVVELYNNVLWNEQRHDLAESLLAPSVIRHGIGEVRTLTHEQAAQRVVDTWASVGHLYFKLIKVVADAELVCIVYECHTTAKTGQVTVTSSIEVFRVVNGRICEVWNVAHAAGDWR
jgi:predicted SnoaL-like aldol condensation-catalyzing enzyme